MRKPRSAYNYLWQEVDKKRKTLLGIPFGTAQRQLNKAIMFELTKVVDCYRCDKPILCVEEFSIDHKESWQKATDPRAAFFDLNNIAFSHLKCNMGAGGKMCAGGGHYKAKLTEADVVEIRRRWGEGGVLLRELATEYDMSISGVDAVVKRRSWKHVTDDS